MIRFGMGLSDTVISIHMYMLLVRSQALGGSSYRCEQPQKKAHSASAYKHLLR